MKKYVYPKFSKYELPGIRIAGPGLGNLLFIYSRAIVFAQKNNYEMICPTWMSLRIGPWLRHESDKRLYNGLFKNNTGDISGIKKWMLLLFSKKEEYELGKSNDSKIILFTYKHMKITFEDLKDFHMKIYENIMNNLIDKNKVVVKSAQSIISVHIRLGDFAMENQELLNQGKNNIRTSIDWYVKVIKSLQNSLGKQVEFHVFSDGNDNELKEILELPNTKRVFYGSSIADIVAMSQSKLIVASGSSFSLWARFLGQTCCIAAPGQMKCSTLIDLDSGIEFEWDVHEKLPLKIENVLKRLFIGTND